MYVLKHPYAYMETYTNSRVTLRREIAVQSMINAYFVEFIGLRRNGPFSQLKNI